MNGKFEVKSDIIFFTNLFLVWAASPTGILLSFYFVCVQELGGNKGQKQMPLKLPHRSHRYKNKYIFLSDFIDIHVLPPPYCIDPT